MTPSELAKKDIFDDAKDTGKIWKGYKVYEPIFFDNEPRCIGLPHFILEKNGIVRFTTDKECFKVLDLVYPDAELKQK